MKINQKGIDLIKHFEGKRLTGYIDPVGIPTIGYGHTGPGVKVGVTISEEKAEELLLADLEKFETGVSKKLTISVGSNAFSALVSFAFNTGLGNFGTSTLRKKLNAGDTRGASKEFPRWVKGTINGRKVTLPGLVRRRKAERALFETPDGATAAITPAAPTGAGDAFFYIVRPGDTFPGIAARNGLSIEALLNWNPHIADDNLLFPGDLVRFQDTPPVDGDQAPASGDAEPPEDAIASAEAPWYGLAKREIGVSEVSGQLHNNTRILDYHRSTKLDSALAAKDETPWCSSFVNWCVEGGGLKGTDSAMARSWLTWGEKLDTPREGCIVVFARPRAGPKSGHVGFFVKETAERIRVLGGNQSNQVKQSNYGKDDWLGYRWPKGKPKPPAAAPAPGAAVEPDDGPAGGDDVFYFVQPGDTLKAIADRAGVRLDHIRAWNPQITNPNRIFPGDSILLVGADATPPDDPPLPANSKTPWFELARRELGTKEEKGSARNNPRILEYHASTTLPGNLARIDETAWCSSFVNWCISRVGLKGTDSARARSWEKWGRKLTEPRPGCITVFSRPAGGPKSGHVAFYISETADRIKVLGGNQSNRVMESSYPKSRLLGYRWPSDMPTGNAAGGSGGGSGGAGARPRQIRPPFLSRLKLLRNRIRGRRRSGT